MAKRRGAATPTIAEDVLDAPQESVLDVLDHLLSKGVSLTGDVTLGVAGVDLVYLRLSALLAAADRVLPGGTPDARRRLLHKPKPPIGGRRR